jgi:hypothetical protein
MRFLLFLAIPATLMAQALQFSPSTAARGGTSFLLIRLDSPPQTALVSLQWDLSVPKRITVNLRDIVVGSSAESAGKSIACAVGIQARNLSIFRCLVAGGPQTIGNGPVAIVKYTVTQGGHRGNIPLRIEKALGVSQDVRKIAFPNTQGTVTVR